MRYQTELRFFISLRENVSNSVVFTVIKKYGNVPGRQISRVFVIVYHVA